MAGYNAPGTFLVTPSSGRGLVIPSFYSAVRTASNNRFFVRFCHYDSAVRTGSSNTQFFFGGHLPQTSARSKQYLPKSLLISRLFARIFMKVGVEKYWQFNGKKTPSKKARMKVLESFQAGIYSPNLPWHVNITSLKHRSRLGEVPCFRQVE